MSYEAELIRKIEAGTNAVKGKRKSPKEVQLGPLFIKLKPLNGGMHDDLMNNYKVALQSFNS